MATGCCRKASISSSRMMILGMTLLLVHSAATMGMFGPSSINMGRFGGTNHCMQLSTDKHLKDITAHESANIDATKDRINAIRTTSVTLLASLVEITASAAATGAVAVTDQLTYLQTMTAGALSRTMAQTLMHPANTYKTLLQLRGSGNPGGILTKLTPERLLRGVDAQFIMSLPHGAFYFFVIDQVKTKLSGVISSKFDFLQDFAASTISTVFCSIVSTPQMVLTDRLMAGVYPTSIDALKSILSTEGIAGFYTGWWPALAQKIPSYGLVNFPARPSDQLLLEAVFVTMFNLGTMMLPRRPSVYCNALNSVNASHLHLLR